MEILTRIAAFIVALLLYGVIAILQMPRVAHAANGLPAGAAHSSVPFSLPFVRDE